MKQSDTKSDTKSATRNLTMTLYQSHKQIYATLMTRGEYTDYRGWGDSIKENLSDEGYLVLNNQGTIDYYESWIPKKQFEEAKWSVITGN